MKILGIETSCDETGLALIEGSPSADPGQSPKIRVIENLLRSQIDVHAPYGGVVPNLAKREHQRTLPVLFDQLIKLTKLKAENLDLIAVTQGPGLSPCLWQGINFAAELASSRDVPLVGVNHLKGHIYIVYPENKVEYPVLSLIVSGGHTELVWSEKLGEFKIIGQTRDDAAGEAFDKVARLLGLAYPGGPEISRVAQKGDPKLFDFPRPMADSPDFDFSFAGLKTAVTYLVRGVAPSRKPIDLSDQSVADIAASFQKAAVDVLVLKTIRAAKTLKPKTIILGGGVAANTMLREELEKNVTTKLGICKLILPDRKLTTDNGLMIALAAFYEHDTLKPKKELVALPNLKIDQN